MNAPTGLPVPLRYWAILSLLLGVTLAVLDGAIANVALPTIAQNLRASDAASIWVVNAYQLTITISLLPLSSLGDRIGYRRVYIPGLLLFTLASLGCAMSHTLVALAVLRVIQGFGAAGIMSVNAALVRMIYPVEQLGRGIAINAMTVALASAIGPTLASAVLAVAPWPWLFAINVPIGLAAFAVGRYALPLNRGRDTPYDYSSALMNAAVFGLVILAVDGLGHGARLAYVAGALLLAALLGYVLVKHELRQAAPLVPVDLLRIPAFAFAIGTSVASFTAQMLAYVALPFWLQHTLGLSQVETGLYMTPWPLAIVFAAPLAGRLSDRHHAGRLSSAGLVLLAAGLLALARLDAHPSAFALIWRMALCGAGFGFFQAPNNRTMLAAAPAERSGGASGMLGTARLSGQTLGAAIVALLFGVMPQYGPTGALYLAAAFALAAAAVSTARLRYARGASPS